MELVDNWSVKSGEICWDSRAKAKRVRERNGIEEVGNSVEAIYIFVQFKSMKTEK